LPVPMVRNAIAPPTTAITALMIIARENPAAKSAGPSAVAAPRPAANGRAALEPR